MLVEFRVSKTFIFLMLSMYSLIKRRDLRRLICICVVRKDLGPVVQNKRHR